MGYIKMICKVFDVTVIWTDWADQRRRAG